MKKMRKWANSCLQIGVAAGILILAVVAGGQAIADSQGKEKAIEKQVQGQQQSCPSPPGEAQCQVNIDCPPIKPPGETTCQAGIDCPPAKQKKANEQKGINK